MQLVILIYHFTGASQVGIPALSLPIMAEELSGEVMYNQSHCVDYGTLYGRVSTPDRKWLKAGIGVLIFSCEDKVLLGSFPHK